MRNARHSYLKLSAAVWNKWRAMHDITLVNMNLLYVVYADRVDRELHVPLGLLYLVSVLEEHGCRVDLRDYQLATGESPFDVEHTLAFLEGSAPIVGFSCMANLLPYTLLVAQALKAHHPEKTVVLGGTGPTAVERDILQKFDAVDVIVRGEGERTIVDLMDALTAGRDLHSVAGISYRPNGSPVENPSRPRLTDLDALPWPAYHRVEMAAYQGYGLVTSRGCPYRCTFCSVAPIWEHQAVLRSVQSVVAEMRHLFETYGVTLFLLQDEYFVSDKARMLDFCATLKTANLPIHWKCFARINLVDEEMLRAMADAGCVHVRYGVESGSDAVLRRVAKGFTARQASETIALSAQIFPEVDAFFIWGFPFETMADFYKSVFQMALFRSWGVRVLPCLLSFLPQTAIHQDYLAGKYGGDLHFCPDLTPEYVATGHETSSAGRIAISAEQQPLFDFIAAHPDLFPGFLQWEPETNVRPKLQVLCDLGFYQDARSASGGRLSHKGQR
jgi:anaerobic magnesium-protoporphyrin IX monomethyl ester cyclase